MRAAKLLAVLAIAALGIGSFSAVALAGKQKKKTAVVFFKGSPTFSNSGPQKQCAITGCVHAEGSLNSVSACEQRRLMRLQVLDTNGVVLRTVAFLNHASGNWKFSSGLLGPLPPGTNYVRVNAKKRTVGKFVCQAGVSPNVAIPAV
jgi:hypothetical protein